MIDGEGDPNGSHIYSEAVEALFALSYTAKFMVKKGLQQIDYAVMPLEGLWWAEDMSEFLVEDKSNWKWTMMILQPEIARLHQFIDERSQKTGKHHEIYLSDIRKAAPEKWKTILRQPMI